LTRRQPIILDDVHSDPRIPQDYEYREAELKSALLMPILVTGNVVAVGCAYTLHGYRRFSREEIALAKGMGEMLGLVIRNAQMYEQSKLLTVMEERVRLSREMHDGIAQTLGALQLKASQLEDLVAKDRVGEWEYYLPEVQDMISRAYSDLREAIMGLRSVAEPGAGLVAALREYLTHFQPQYGVSVSLEASEGEPVILDGMAQAQAVRIVQEALSNVRRHSGVSAASLRIERRADAVRVSVVDGGRGFDAALLERRTHGTHLGLRTMAERAASVGGALTVHSAPGFGTRVVLELPLARNRGGS
jgi:signal transduction histidine kinase